MVINWLVFIVLVTGCLADTDSFCNNDEVFCVITGQCINRDIDCKHQNVIDACQKDEVFCLYTGKCVKVERTCSEDNQEYNCHDDEAFCLENGECRKKEDSQCGDDNEAQEQCPTGTVKCLQTGNCVEVSTASCQNVKDSTFLKCPEGTIICLKTGNCVHKDNSCQHIEGDLSEPNCPEGQIKCLQTGQCIDTGQYCHGNDDGCSEGEILCLQTGKCIKKENLCEYSTDVGSEDIRCGSDETFCLLVGKCIQNENSCLDIVERITCPEGYIKCLQTGHCVTTYDGCVTSNVGTFQQCSTSEIFCLRSGHCIARGTTCDVLQDDKHTTDSSCADNQIKCLQTGECIDTGNDCHGNNGGCFEGEILCLQTGKCIKRENQCESLTDVASADTKCSTDETFCLHDGKCIKNGNSCLGSVERVTCPEGYIKCLQTGHCVTTYDGCVTTNVSTSEQCSTSEVFCLWSGHCIERGTTCDTLADDRHTTDSNCADDQIKCLQTGECIDTGNDCHGHNGGCSEGEILCLQTGKCIKIENQCEYSTDVTSDDIECRSDETFCLHVGKCIKNENSCLDLVESVTCPEGYIKCLHTGHCVTTYDGCVTTNMGTFKQCVTSDVFCLKGGHCIERRITCDALPDDRHKTDSSCTDNQIKCLQTGECIDTGNDCHEYDYGCPVGEILCLQTGKCIKIGNQCESLTDVGSEDIRCGTNETFCLRVGKCIKNDNSCLDSTERVICPEGYIKCLQTGDCVTTYDGCVTTNVITSQQCITSEIFCLMSGYCIERGTTCDVLQDDKHRTDSSCADNQIKCLQTGECINIRNECDYYNHNITVRYCESGETMCLQTGKCIAVTDACDNNGFYNTSSNCPSDQVMCLKTGTCATMTIYCDDIPFIDCPIGQIMCMQTGKCIAVPSTCDYKNVDVSPMNCSSDQVVCLQSGSCVSTACLDDDIADVNITSVNNDTRTVTLDDISVMTLEHTTSLQLNTSMTTNYYMTSDRDKELTSFKHTTVNVTYTMDYSTESEDNSYVSSTTSMNYDTEWTTRDMDHANYVTTNILGHLNATTDIDYVNHSTKDNMDDLYNTTSIDNANYSTTDNMYHLYNTTSIDNANHSTTDNMYHLYNTTDMDYVNYTTTYRSHLNRTTTKMNYGNSTTINEISTFEHTSDVVPSTTTEDNSTSMTGTESTINSFTTTPTTGTESTINSFTTTQTTGTESTINSFTTTQTTGTESTINRFTTTPTTGTESTINSFTTTQTTGTESTINSFTTTPTTGTESTINSFTTTQTTGTESTINSFTTTQTTGTESTINSFTTTPTTGTESTINSFTTTPTTGTESTINSLTTTQTTGTESIINSFTTIPTTGTESTINSFTTTQTTGTESTINSLTTTQTTGTESIINSFTTTPTTGTESTINSFTTTPTTGTESTINRFTTTQTMEYVHILFKEPLFLYEEIDFVVNDTIIEYNVGSQLQMECNNNVVTLTGTPMGSNSTPVTFTDKIVLSVMAGSEGKCRIVCDCSPSKVFVVHIRIITDPLPPTVNFALSIKEIHEDTTYIYFNHWQDWYNITLNEKVEDINSFNMSDAKQRHFVQIYQEKLFHLHHLEGVYVQLMLIQVPLNTYGVPVAILEIHDDNKWNPRLMTYTLVDILKGLYRIKFTQTCNCQFTIQLRQRGDVTNNDSITIEVKATNDSPVLTNRAILRYSRIVEELLLFPYVYSNTEFKIRNFINQFYFDEDNNEALGLAVIGLLSDTIGTWEYYRNNTWNVFPLIDITTLNDNINVTVYLIGPNDTLRFVPVNSTYLWTRQHAITYTKLYVLGWDGYSPGINYTTDHIKIQRCFGVHHKICGPGGSSAYSKDIIHFYINRAGCDGVASSLMTADMCGVCGGHDDCIDCTGAAHGGAAYDMCGDCTGGTSGMVYGHNLDCNSECGTNYFEQRLQMCIKNGTDVDGLLSLVSCDSVLNSGAYINKCGHCVRGTTSLPSNHGEDVCRVCDGDGTSCLDCDNVVNGNKMVDFCGECLDPSDSSFNKGCMKLGSVRPSLLRDFGQHTLHVEGVKLHLFTAVECTLKGKTTITVNVTMFNTTESKLDLLIPAFSGDVKGTYNLSCVFDSNTTLLLENSIVIYQYLQLTDISPSIMTIGQQIKVNITTSTIADTGFIQCILMCPFAHPGIGCFPRMSISAIRIPTTVLSSSTVQCDISQMGCFSNARDYNLSVTIEQRDKIDVTRLSTLEFIIRAEAPIIQAATFDKSFCYVNVLFNTGITGPKTCSDLFHQTTLNLLGTDPFCIIVGKRILVDLGQGNTLRPGDIITLQPNAIYRSGSTSQYADFAAGNIPIYRVLDAMQPGFSLSGPSLVGSCDEFDLVLVQSNGGCMTFTNEWTTNDSADISWTNTTEFTSLLDRIKVVDTNPRMMTILSNEIPPGESVEFIVTVHDSFNNKSYTVRHNVTREVNLNPVSVDLVLLGDELHVDPAKIVRFYARTKVANCYNVTEGKIRLSWQSESTDFSVSVFNDKPIAAIRPNTLRGGSKYTVTINAFLEDDPSIAAVDTVSFYTISKPLMVSVDGAEYMVFSVDQEIVLDAGISQDPDRQNLPAFYSWTCIYENNFPCFTQNGNTTELMSTTFSSNERVVIPANTLSIGTRLMWTVTMTVGQRSGSFTTTIETVNILPPIIALQETNITVNPDDDVRIPCTVTSHGPVMMMWTGFSKDGYDTVDLTDLLPEESVVQETTEAISNWDFSLYLDLSDDTSLPAGAKIIFSVSAFALDNEQSSEQYVYVTVNTPPTTGDIQVFPSNGTSLTTDFTIDIGNGWTDIDGDSTVFFFYVKETSLEWMRLNPRGLSEMYNYDFKLTAGVYDVMVEICDTYDACSSVEITSAITVIDKSFTATELNQTAASISKALKSDINQAIGMALTFSSLLGSSTSNNTSAVTSVVNDVTANLLTSVVASYDPADATSVLDLANAMLQRLSDSGGLTDTVTSESQSLAYELASFVTKGTDKSRRRRKRSTTVTVSPMSVSDAGVILTTYSATFATQSEDGITADSANQYLEALDNIFIGICATVSYAEEAVVIKSSLATLSINKRTVENTGSNVYDVTCNNCSQYISHPAKVTYGTSIQSKYTHWNCSSYLSCYGACFVSAQITKDLVTPTSPSEMSLTNRVRRSDIVILKLANPAEHTLVTMGTLMTPVLLSISVIGDVNTTAYGLQCLRWNQNTWVDTTCTASKPYISKSVYTVTCSCSTTGYIALFEGPVVIDDPDTTIDTIETVETTTVVEESTATVTVINIPESTGSVKITFTIAADYNSVIGNDKSALMSDIKHTVANVMGVDGDRIKYMTLEPGSIIVTFTIEDDGQTIESAVQKLHSAILSDSLVIRDSNGTVLDIVKSSFSYRIVEKEPLGDTSDHTTLYIILGCIGGLLAVAVAVIATLLYKMKKDNIVSNSQPPPYGPQMHGVDVPIPVNGYGRQVTVKDSSYSSRTSSKKQSPMNSKPCVKGMYDAGHGSTKQEVDLIAAENGRGGRMNVSAGYSISGQTEYGVSGQTGYGVSGQTGYGISGQTGYGISGQTGYRVNPLNTQSQTNWYESETPSNIRPGSARSIPGPADYMPPISG